MSDSNDWKQKYRDSLIEMQAEEDRWRHTEQVLRRLVGRLCAAGMGIDLNLDGELSALAAANRRNAAADELARMAESLTSTVVAVDATQPVLQIQAPKAPAIQKVHAALTRLLERLPVDGSESTERQALLSELKSATADGPLAGVVERIADLIHEHSEQLARERLQAASVLSEVTKRLEEVARYLTQSQDADEHRFVDARSHDESVLWQVRELSGEVHSAGELSVLQKLVSTRLERVVREISEFRAREENRLLESNGRAEKMRARVADLERESQELVERLGHEKQVARLDPLTGVANRMFYEERIAHELARVSGGEGCAALLLWDIDDFKRINDSYGHRAGDRVLQNVARCFGTAARGSDFVARIGGEEFVLLLAGAHLTEAVQVANQVRAAVESLRFHFRGTPVRVTVSCGVTELQAGETHEATYDRADAALYRAKNGGKNVCVAA